MRILRQKRGPPKPTDWRRLALATGLRYATPVGQGKTKNKQHTPDSQESISSNRLATFCSASLAPYSAPFTNNCVSAISRLIDLSGSRVSSVCEKE